MTAPASRYPAVAILDEYIRLGLSGTFGVEGDPPGQMIVDSARKALAIRVPAAGDLPDTVGYAHIRVDEVSGGESVWHELSVDVGDNARVVYAVLSDVMDRIQLEGVPFSTAVTDAIDSFGAVLAPRSRISEEKQVGLFAELLVLLALSTMSGADAALEAWRGPVGEEHDFGLKDIDLEVKCTIGENRVHWISSLTQLVPTGDRPLRLVSLQLTRAGLGQGHSLPSLVRVLRCVPGLEVAKLDGALRGHGFWDADAELYPTRWALRTEAAFFPVDGDFPALTRARVNAAVPAAVRVVDVRYRVDLTDLPEASAPFAVTMPGPIGEDE